MVTLVWNELCGEYKRSIYFFLLDFSASLTCVHTHEFKNLSTIWI